MSWKSQPRPSFTHVSTHQTYVGKALYEHAPDCATIAAVACMSSSLLKSSLGPNLLALIRVDDDDTFDLFDKIFLEYNPHMQLTRNLDLLDFLFDPGRAAEIINKLKSNGSHFSSSLQKIEIGMRCFPLFEGFHALRSVKLDCGDRDAGSAALEYDDEVVPLAIVKSLPSLTELELVSWRELDAGFFKVLGDLENDENFTWFNLEVDGSGTFNPVGFKNDLCGRLLSKNRLRKLSLDANFWELLTDGELQDVFIQAGMTNLVQLGNFIPAKLIRGEGFANLRVLSAFAGSDEDLVNIGNHCSLLQDFTVAVDVGSEVTGSFLADANLVKGAFVFLKTLEVVAPNFSDMQIGTGFSRLPSLEKLTVRSALAFDGSSLQHLPSPERLRSISLESRFIFVANLHRFVNLEEIALENVFLSREHILSLVGFTKLKSIALLHCGEHCDVSEPFRILCPQLPELEMLTCCEPEESGWAEEDVEVLLSECQWLRNLQFKFNECCNDRRIIALEKKYPRISIQGALMAESIVQRNDVTTTDRSN